MKSFVFYLKYLKKHLLLTVSFYCCKNWFKRLYLIYFEDDKPENVDEFLAEANGENLRSKMFFNLIFITLLTIIICVVLYFCGIFGQKLGDYLRAFVLIIVFTGSTSRLQSSGTSFSCDTVPENIDYSLYYTSQLCGVILLMFALWSWK